MPLVKIELHNNYSTEFLNSLSKTIMDCVVETLKLPENDRNLRVLQYDASMLTFKSPYKILIEIMLFKGRTRETKKQLYRTIVNKLEDADMFGKEEVFIVLNEQPIENWALSGGLIADEIKLGFDVNI